MNCSYNDLYALDISGCTALKTIYATFNHLTSMDASKNTSLDGDYFNVGGETYTIQTDSLDELKQFGFDGSKTSSWRGAYYDPDTNKIYDLTSNNISYKYDCGGNKTATFNITVETNDKSIYDPEKIAKRTINEENFPDNNFIYTVRFQDKIKDGILSDTEIADTKKFTVSLNYVNDLKGIELFTALEELTCVSGGLTSVDLSQNKALKKLYLDYNNLTSLDLSNNTMIESFTCHGNTFTLETASLEALTKNGFDPTRASNWIGAEYDEKTNSLKKITSDTVTYTYDAGNGFTVMFTLNTSSIAKADPTKPVVTAEPTYGGANVTWEPVKGAVNYRVYSFVPGGKIRQFGSDTNGTSMTVKGLKGGEKTGIIVLAQFANKKWSTYTEDDIAYVVPLDAVKPYLCVNPKGNGNYYLIWSSVPTSVRYKVMAREKGTNNWELIGATRSRCRITVELDPGKQYEFLVRGLNAKNKYTPMDADDIVSG